MLRKLMKHELRATAHILLPLYGLVLVSAICGNFSIRALPEAEHTLTSLLASLLITGFALSIAAMTIAAPVLMIWRFHRNLLGDEGYLMMTLPVSVHQQVGSKLLVSLLWLVISAAVLLLSSSLLVLDAGVLEYTIRTIRDVLRNVIPMHVTVNGFLTLALFLLLGLCSAAASILHCYAAMAIGHSFDSHKVLCSIAAFLVIRFVLQLLDGLALNSLPELLFRYESPWLAILGMAAAQLLQGALFYAVTVWFLKHRLNLE